jgi:gliding motility-associated-like protein
VCIGDEVLLQAAGGASYKWLPEDKVYNANNQVYTKILTPTTYSVIVKSEYGCLDTADITYDDIEQCCTFSYPNAFTPNGDGTNDGFRALLYGNASEYLLAVYNRWGQQVFRTSDPRQAWDGNFHGKSCEAGVYFYRLKAMCLTGHVENKSGDFTLLR